MKFSYLKVSLNDVEKKFDFSDKTLIFSEKNSVGKSTLLRLLFYGLGYPIPGTYGLKFKDINTEVSFSRNKTDYLVKRKKDYIELYKGDDLLIPRNLTGDDDSWFVNIWGIDSVRVLKNILGAVYMDQDKGWTLLNRGKVIGNIRFNIRDLLIGLSKDGQDFDEDLTRLDEERNILNQTRQLQKLSKFSEDFKSIEPDIPHEEIDDTLINKYNNLKMKYRVIGRKLQEVKKNIAEKEGLNKFLVSLHITVQVENKKIVIDENNLQDFNNNIEYLRQKSAMLQEDKERMKKEMNMIEEELSRKTSNLFDNDDDLVQKTWNDIANIDIDDKILQAREKELKDSIYEINKKIEAKFTDSNELIEETTKWINIFAKKLDVLDIVKNKEYIFTRDLKSISGTVYYKVVFSFKMAYIKTIENHCNIKLPIVLDSPSGREVTEENIAVIISILETYFNENQIIIASIYDYPIKDIKTVNLDNGIFN